MRLMSLQVRTSAKRRATRHRDHRFRPETPEGCEPRIVLDGAGASMLAFQVIGTGSNGPGKTDTLTATVPQQDGHTNLICTTFTNTATTDQYATADLFFNPQMSTGAGQTLAARKTVVVPAHGSVEVCFPVCEGFCYQMDARPGDLSATVGNSPDFGSPWENLGNYISYSIFCVPGQECQQPFEVGTTGSSGPGVDQTDGTLTATVPQQDDTQNTISTTFTNTATTDQYATADLFFNPQMSTGAGQTLAARKTVLVPAGQSVTVTFPVCEGECYQMDARPGTRSATVNNSPDFGTPYKGLNNWLSFSIFCVPECPHNGCYTQGYYKNHEDAIISLLGATNGQDTDPDHMLYLGDHGYTADQLVQILKTPPSGGNSYLILAHQLITAELNVLNGCTPTEAQWAAIDAANQVFDGVNLLNNPYAKNPSWNQLADILDAFNNQDE